MSDGWFGIRTVLFFSLMLVAAGVVGCTDVDPPPESERNPSRDDPAPDAGEMEETEDEPAPLAAGEWEAMDFDARKQFMAAVVLPAVSPLFREFDPERFAAVSCKTCHGSGARNGDFVLPNADLPVLHSAALKNPPEELQPILGFMREVLKPKVAELLGVEGSALKCGACHQMEP
jgi:hypothetical protein